MRGSLKALEALKWVLDGAASPQETELALPFYLPLKLEGKGFVAPTMNYKVELTPQEQAIAQTEHFRIDVCWPERKVGFEYNSFAEHTEPWKIADDERRKLILCSKGYHVELVTQEQLKDPRQIDLLAHILEERDVAHVR